MQFSNILELTKNNYSFDPPKKIYSDTVSRSTKSQLSKSRQLKADPLRQISHLTFIARGNGLLTTRY